MKFQTAADCGGRARGPGVLRLPCLRRHVTESAGFDGPIAISGHPRPIALSHKLEARSGYRAVLLRNGRKRESIHASWEFIREI